MRPSVQTPGDRTLLGLTGGIQRWPEQRRGGGEQMVFVRAGEEEDGKQEESVAAEVLWRCGG